MVRIGHFVCAPGRRAGARAHELPTALSPVPAPVTAIAPSVSVRSTTAPPARSASTVRGAGCPYGLSLPTLTRASLGRAVCSRAGS